MVKISKVQEVKLNLYEILLNYVIQLYLLEASGGYFGLAFATPPPPLPPPHIEIFGVKALNRKTTPVRFTKFAGYLHWGVSFSGTEISLILKNKMAAAGISLKIIYIFLLAVSDR